MREEAFDGGPIALDDEPMFGAAPKNGFAPLAICIFCHGPSTDVTYAWPDWLCRFLAEHQGLWFAEPTPRHSDLVMVERAEQEADKTVSCVCQKCREGWMQRLEDNVSPFLKPMMLGDATPLPAARRKLLARWAAKTAMLVERASDAPLPTPGFASEYLRKVGIHTGTQVLVGRYDGRLQMLTAERDVFPRTVNGEQRHFSQTSLVMGSVLLHVYADPWRDTPPELTENAVRPFIALIGNHGRSVSWPPGDAVDDALYDLVRLGPATDTRETQGSREVQEGHQETMETDIATPESLVSVPPTWAAMDSEPDPQTADSDVDAPPRRRRPALAYAAIALLVAVGLLGFGLRQRSDATGPRAQAATTQRRNRALESAVGVKNRQLRASQSRIEQLQSRVATLTAGKRPGPSPAGLANLVNAVPGATDALRQCASSALATASDALDFAAAFPTSEARVDAAATAVANVCGHATATANTLDDLADAAQR